MKTLATSLKDRSFQINTLDNLQGTLGHVVAARESGDPKRIARQARNPAFVTAQAQKFLSENPQLGSEMKARFEKLIADAAGLAAS